MAKQKPNTGRTTLGVCRKRLREFHRALRIVDGRRAAEGKPELSLHLAVDILLSLAHGDYVQHFLINHDKVLESPVATCFNVPHNSSTAPSDELSQH